MDDLDISLCCLLALSLRDGFFDFCGKCRITTLTEDLQQANQKLEDRLVALEEGSKRRR